MDTILSIMLRKFANRNEDFVASVFETLECSEKEQYKQRGVGFWTSIFHVPTNATFVLV